MSPRDPHQPEDENETQSGAERTPPPEPSGSGGGVRVIVRERRQSQAAPPPAPAPRPPRVVVRPPTEAVQARNALLEKLHAEHEEFIRTTLLRRGDVLEESTKDLGQEVLLHLCQRIEEKGLPDNVRGYLTEVIRRIVSNHKQAWKPKVAPGAEADEEASAAPDPETSATLAERRAKLSRYVGELSDEEADVIRCVGARGMTIEETAADLGRPVGTVATQLARARDKLRDQAQDSARRERVQIAKKGPSRA